MTVDRITRTNPKLGKPRVNEFRIDKPKNYFKDRSRSIKSVSIEKISINDKAEQDLKSGKGFIIDDPNPLDKRDNKTIGGLFSPKYGVDTFSDKDLDMAYRCDCGDLTGAIHDGDTCDICNSVCKFCEPDITIAGYISLGKYFCINPCSYLDLASLMGGKELEKILKYSTNYNTNGHNVGSNTKNPYHGLGMIGFYKKFDEICEYYRRKRKDKEAYYQNIQRFKHAVFTNFVNPYSSHLRPLVKSEEKMCQFKVNKCYGIILNNSIVLKSPVSEGQLGILEPSLFEIQQKFNEIFDIIINEDFKGKNGVLRAKVTARVDNSARIVIVSGRGLHIDEIDLPYHWGLETMRPILIRELSKIDGITIRAANDIIDKAMRKFNKRVWILMNYILQNSKEPPRAMIQRSPSLLQESIRVMRIRSIKADFYDLTMSVPIGILSGIAGDFDGKELLVTLT